MFLVAVIYNICVFIIFLPLCLSLFSLSFLSIYKIFDFESTHIHTHIIFGYIYNCPAHPILH